MRELSASAGHKNLKNGGNLIFVILKKNYYATADISVRSDNFPTNRR